MINPIKIGEFYLLKIEYLFLLKLTDLVTELLKRRKKLSMADNWKPITEKNLWDIILDEEEKMQPKESIVWDAIRIIPSKWDEKSYGSVSGGFWAVAVIGQSVIWYNDIEDGFNISRFTEHGIIKDYWCDQSELHHLITKVRHNLLENPLPITQSGSPIAGPSPKST